MEFMLNQYYQQLAMFIIVNAILGISIYLTLSTGQLSLGNAGFMSIGAYTSALLTVKAGLPMFVSVPIGGLAACCIAVLIGLPTTRLQGIYLAIAIWGLVRSFG
jgi:branched-chain amino acid transport system permease protein